MTRTRVRLVVGLVVSALAAAAASFVLLDGAANAKATAVVIHVALVVVQIAFAWAATSTREKALSRLAEFLRGVSIGKHDARLELATMGELEDVARAANEVAAAHAEREDPSIGSVKSKKRDGAVPVPPPSDAVRPRRLPSFPSPEAAQAPSSGADVSGPHRPSRYRGQESEHPEIGPVRVIPKAKAKAPADDEPDVHAVTPSTEDAASERSGPSEAAAHGDEESSSREPSTPPADAHAADAAPTMSSTKSVIDVLPAREADSAPHERPTTSPRAASDAVDDEATRMRAPEGTSAARADDAPPAPRDDTTVDDGRENATIPATPADDERLALRMLFDEYILTKKAHDEPVADLEFDAFAHALGEERKKLMDAHLCRDVRFEIKVQNGEVSLLPRLIR